MKLRDVVDLEAQLAIDEGAEESALRERDRALYLALTPPPSTPEALIVAWLDALRERFGAPRLGERVAAAQRLLGYLLVALGLTSGWGITEVLLQFEQGGAPVNVGYFLFVLVLGQLATLLLLGVGLLLRRVWPALPLVGDVARVLRFAVDRLQRYLRERHGAMSERLDAEAVAYRRVRTRVGLYHRIERALLLSHTQLFAVAFNLGALASCLRLILLSDLAFAWSTSVTSLDAEQVERLCTALAWPFAWLLPEAVPSRALIEHTQYFRLEGRFAGAPAGTRGDAALAGEWWRFLVACTVSYGLLPRLVTCAIFLRQFRRAQRDVPLDTPAVQRVVARLTTPALSTRATAVSDERAEPARPALERASARAETHVLLLFRDVPTAVELLKKELFAQLGITITSIQRVGGADVQAEATLAQTLQDEHGSVALLAEAWEAPDKSLRGLLAELRRVLGPRRTMRVVLVGEAREDGFAAPAAEDVRVYQDRLTLLEDPYLIVDTLAASGERARADEARA